MIATARHIFWHMHSIDNEEEHLAPLAGVSKSENWSYYALFMVATSLDFFADDLDLGIPLSFTDRLDQDLILCGNDFVQSEFELTDKIMPIPGFQILKVINIVNYHLEQLLLFKFVGHVKALDPLGIQVVHDDLCQTQHLPHVASLLIQDCHTISSSERVQVWQFLACKGQSQNLT